MSKQRGRRVSEAFGVPATPENKTKGSEPTVDVISFPKSGSKSASAILAQYTQPQTTQETYHDRHVQVGLWFERSNNEALNRWAGRLNKSKSAITQDALRFFFEHLEDELDK